MATDERDPDACFLESFEQTSEFEPGHPKYAAYRNFNLSAVDRGRIVVHRLRAELRLEGARALDVGTGSGGIAIALAEAGALVDAVEPDPVRRQWARERIAGHAVPVRLGDAAGERLPFPSESFDLVVLDSVIEHVEDPAQVISEVTRVLRPRGVVYLVSPNKLSIINILRDPHYDMFGVVLLPRVLGKLYVERIRKVERGYWVNVTPTKRWLIRHFAQGNVVVEHLVPDGFDKLAEPGASIRGPWVARAAVWLARRVGAVGALHHVALAQYPTFILLGRNDPQIGKSSGLGRDRE